jgi:hypothetical protein
MVRLIMLAVAAAWAGVIVPPLLRSRAVNRPNSSVDDFRRQLSTLQRTVPTRGVSPMRSMARPLAPAPQRQHDRQHDRHLAPARSHRTVVHRDEHVGGERLMHLDRRPADSTRSHHRQTHMPRVSQREIQRRRRANVLFVLVMVNVCTLFLAVTSNSKSMTYVFALAFVSLFGYVAKLVQIRNQQTTGRYDTWFNAA